MITNSIIIIIIISPTIINTTNTSPSWRRPLVRRADARGKAAAKDKAAAEAEARAPAGDPAASRPARVPVARSGRAFGEPILYMYYIYTYM